MMITNDRRVNIIPKTAEKPPWETIDFINYYSSGREGLLDFLSNFSEKNIEQRVVLLPAYLPEGILLPFQYLNWNLYFYSIDENLQPDISQLEKLVQDHRPSIVVVIHFFGIKAKIDDVKNICVPYGVLLIEDFSHLVEAEIQLEGDLGLCSLTKIIDVPDGAFIISKKKLYDQKPSSFLQNNFRYKFFALICFLSQSASLRSNKIIQKINSVIHRIFQPYPELLRTFTKINDMSKHSLWYMSKHPFYTTMSHQQTINQYYRNNIENSLVFIPEAIEQTTAISFGFTILIKNRDSFKSYMLENGVNCISLVNKWDYRSLIQDNQTLEKTSRILAEHIILPNRYLTKSDAEKVILLVNQWTDMKAGS